MKEVGILLGKVESGQVCKIGSWGELSLRIAARSCSITLSLERTHTQNMHAHRHRHSSYFSPCLETCPITHLYNKKEKLKI